MSDLRQLINKFLRVITGRFWMATYFHVSPVDHPIGTVLSPGRAGIQYRRYVTNGNLAPQNHKEAYELTWESVLETARRLSAPTAPSRLNCIYGCTTLAAAQAFRDKYRSGAPIFKIKVSKSTPTFFGDLEGLSNAKPGEPFLDKWVETAIKYWAQEPKGATEVLIGGAVTVSTKV
jgi:hypothetical protein